MTEIYLSNSRTLQFWTSTLVVLPVFLQAPWVHFFPISALLFTFIILGAGISLEHFLKNKFHKVGSLLIGVSGSWLGGCLFWGWLRQHPALHIPVEAVALPIAFIGLDTKWRLGSGFYLSCLLGTAFTDLLMCITGVMDSWTIVLEAPIESAAKILHETSISLINPLSLIELIIAAFLIVFIANQMRNRGNLNSPVGETWLVASAALMTTLWVDTLFILTTIIQPNLSGLI